MNETECFICLDSIYKCKKGTDVKKLNCCHNQIHNYCLINLFLYNHNNCPLCRRNLDIYDYISKKEFSDVISMSEHFVLFFSPKIAAFYFNYALRKYFISILLIYTCILLLVCTLIVVI
jgi:hypothetical protein